MLPSCLALNCSFGPHAGASHLHSPLPWVSTRLDALRAVLDAGTTHSSLI